jgi:hypothetical protein
MVNFNNLIIQVLLCLMLTSKVGICADPDDGTKAIKAGYMLVENFYSCLTSTLKRDSCGKIFTNSPYLPKNEIDLIWEYANKNKQLFVPNSDTIKDKDFFKRSRRTISYFNPRNIERISDGYLYITVVHTLMGRFYSGIYKEIAFPIVKDEISGEYRIEFRNIKINGIIIDFDNEFERDFDIIENLGFKSEPIKLKTNQKREKLR